MAPPGFSATRAAPHPGGCAWQADAAADLHRTDQADYLLGDKDNYAADRAEGDRVPVGVDWHP
jgi:hypothetical protein